MNEYMYSMNSIEHIISYRLILSWSIRKQFGMSTNDVNK